VIQYVSDKLLVMHGYERADEMIGRPIFEFLDPDYRVQAGLRLAAVLRGDYPRVFGYNVSRRDG
jgi:PAS domain S-box-containing protein